jgi:ABC-2 type transport system ATP-binding protein
MINKGRNVLYGGLSEIKDRFRNNSVLVDYEGDIGGLEGMRINRVKDNSVEIFTEGATTHQQVLERLVARGVIIKKFEVATPSLEEIFIHIAGGHATGPG